MKICWFTVHVFPYIIIDINNFSCNRNLAQKLGLYNTAEICGTLFLDDDIYSMTVKELVCMCTLSLLFIYVWD